MPSYISLHRASSKIASPSATARPALHATNLPKTGSTVRTLVSSVPSRIPSPTSLRGRPRSPKALRFHEGSHYISAHVSEPCTAGSLIHIVASCGHRILTDTGEFCAHNCQACPPYCDQMPNGKYANIKDMDTEFVCQICVGKKLHDSVTSQTEAHRERIVDMMNVGVDPRLLYFHQRKHENMMAEDAERILADAGAKGRKCKAVLGATMEGSDALEMPRVELALVLRVAGGHDASPTAIPLPYVFRDGVFARTA